MNKFIIFIAFIWGYINPADARSVETTQIDSLPKKNSKQQPMKTVNYPGGLITFDIPKNWVEEFEESGSGTFYEDAPNSGTLRVNILTIKPQKDNENPMEVLKNAKQIDRKEYTTKDGNHILEHLTRTKENETPITMFTLVCAHETKQKEYILAVFTWTIETKFEIEQKYIEEWNNVRTQIQKVNFRH